MGVQGFLLRLLATAASVGLALLATTSPAGAEAPAHASIIGGEAASIADFPSLAFIQAQIGPDKGFACTGSVIAPRVILTAGHCILDIESGRMTPPADYEVATGVADLRDVEEANVLHVSRALVYPDFDPSTLHGDAGLLILSTPTAAPVIPLAGPSDRGLYKAGVPAQLAGWGLTDSKSSKVPDILQTTAVQVEKAEYCKHHVGGFYPFYSPGVQMCASTRPAYTSGGCFGDSGGPMIAHRADGVAVEVGIVSAGDPECRTKVPGIFTRVDRIGKWITEWIAAAEAGGPIPRVARPRAKLPRMTRPDAKVLVERALGFDFGARFRRGKGVRIGCERIEREKFKCGVSWFKGPNDYFGTMTVYYAIRRNAVVWGARYKVRWVNARCWFESGDRDSCVIHSKRR